MNNDIFVKKYFHMMFRDLFSCMYSTGYIRKIANAFGYVKYLDDTKYIAKFEIEKKKYGISNYLFSDICNKFITDNSK